MKRAFEFLNVPQRPPKPRQSGMTMMVDWWLPVGLQRDLLQAQASFIDIAKIAVGISGILPRDIAEQKITLYREYNVTPFLGGQFLEYTVAKHGMKMAPAYFKEVADIGFTVVEVSDNNLDISKEDKQSLIRMAVQEYGLTVLGEVGSKNDVSSPMAMVQGIRDCLAAGSWKVFVEGAEFTDKQTGQLLPEVVSTIAQNVPLADIMLELPGTWISNVHSCGIYDMMVFFIEEFGSDMNIANVLPELIVPLETLRTGVGVKLKI